MLIFHFSTPKTTAIKRKRKKALGDHENRHRVEVVKWLALGSVFGDRSHTKADTEALV